MVAALRAATDRAPQVAGKPEPTLLMDALARGTFRMPLVVGDRLDTDIAGANAAGLPSLLVLCGVSTASDTVRAAVGQRPNYIAEDLRSLYARADSLRVGPHPAWYVDVGPSAATVQSTGRDPGDSLTVVRALASAVWSARLDPGSVTLLAGDDTARQAMARWSLLTPSDRLA
jgi:glycerol-1-phosphatase